LTIDNLALGYDDTEILNGVSVSLHPGDRIGLLGKNGAGKSTFLKGLTGALTPRAGIRVPGAHLRIGYFDQQQLEVLDLDASPLLHLQRLTPTSREQTILDFLGGFNFKGDQAKETIRLFSGGEKARLALAMVVWQDPNVLILDEPTNHLDLDMRHALAMALQGYTGAIVLVSHDRHLMRHVVETLWLVQGGSVSEYSGDLAAYEHWVMVGDKGADEAPQITPSAGAVGHGKVQRQSNAERRARLRPLQTALQKTEKALEVLQQTLAKLQAELADPALYEAERRERLSEIVKEEGAVKAEIAILEDTWVEQQEAIDNADE
jgi:ATP-binding cassette subfamily F protein 3